MCGRLELGRDVLDDRGHEIERLRVCTVQHPGVARPDPTDRIGFDAVVEQPAARVHRGFARADHRVAACGLGDLDEVVDRYEARIRIDVERREMRRRNRGFEIRRIDDPPSCPHSSLVTGQPRYEQVLATLLPHVVAHAEEPHPARRQQRLVEDTPEVVAYLPRARARVPTRVRTRRIDDISTEPARVHAVERRGLMEAHERIGVVPVAARAMAPIDHHNIGVGVGDQLVGERHARRTGPDHQVVRFESRHAEILCSVGSSGAAALHPGRSRCHSTRVPCNIRRRDPSGIGRRGAPAVLTTVSWDAPAGQGFRLYA